MLGCIFSLLLVSVAAGPPASVPPNWTVCKQSLPDKDFQSCLAKAAQAATRDVSINGIPSIGMPPIDPMEITRLFIGQGTGPVAIELLFENIKMYGFRGVNLHTPIKYDIANMDVLIPVTFPDGVRMEGDYKITGKVLVLPINGMGRCNLLLKNLTGNAHFTGEPLRKKGVLYAKLNDFKFEFEPTGMQMYFENLFNGNKALSDQMNVFLNENWHDILNELKPAIKEALGLAWKDISNRIFTKIPYNDLFPK